MMKKSVELCRIVSATKEPKPIETFRMGRIVKLDKERDLIWVDYDGNPFQKPLQAKLGTADYGFGQLEAILSKTHSVQIEFIQGDPALPIIREIFFSASMIDLTRNRYSEERVLTLEAEEIVLKGTKRVVIQSGEASTTYRAEGAEIIQDADLVYSSANLSNQIKGGRVVIN